MKRMLPPALGFLALSAVMVVAAMAQRTGLIDTTLTLRAIGVCLGLMAVVTGNFLPKMRPLGASADDIERVEGAERRAGWLLVIMGLGIVGLFLFAPPATARGISPIIALGGIGLIELDWIWTAWISRSGGAAARSRDGAARERRRVAAWLLFGLGYVLVTASLKFLTSDSPRFREVAVWPVLAFTAAYSIFLVVIDFRRRSC